MKVICLIHEVVQLVVGKPASVGLGAFTDDKGAGELDIRISGDRPDGLSIGVPSPGRIVLSGTPKEAGVYSIEVTATDGEGGSATFSASVSVTAARPPENTALRRLIRQTNGSECTFVHVTGQVDGTFTINGYIRRLGPLNKLDNDVKREFGKAPNITAWLVTPPQCRFIDSLGPLPPEMVEHDISIDMGAPVQASGALIDGKVVNGADALLFLVDHKGRSYELQANTRVRGKDLEFKTRLLGLDAQLVVAAIPVTPGALAGVQSIGDFTRPAMRGRVKIAVGYVKLKAR